MKVCFAKIQGSQLLMKNKHLADPLNDFTREMKKFTSKRKKTDDDHMKISEIEFRGSLYVDEKERPIIPGQNIRAMLGAAAKTFKQGKLVEEGVSVLDDFQLNFDGPKNVDKRFKEGYYRREPLKQKNVLVVRTRPLFQNWSVDIKIYYDEETIDPEMVNSWLEVAGRYKGLGDGRPTFGRFNVESIEHKDVAENATA